MRAALLAVAFVVAGATVLRAAPASRGARRRRFAEAIGFAEGFGIPGAIPTVRNNPGDLKLNGVDIATFSSADNGWAALERQLQLIIDGRSAFYTVDMSIADMARVWTTTEQTFWAANVVDFLRRNGEPGVSTATPLAELLL